MKTSVGLGGSFGIVKFFEVQYSVTVRAGNTRNKQNNPTVVVLNTGKSTTPKTFTNITGQRSLGRGKLKYNR